MSYNYISSILKKLTGANMDDLMPKTTQSSTMAAQSIKETYYQTLEDELVELNETSEVDYE